MMEHRNNVGEDFFLKQISVEKIFALIERTDYFFLYNIQHCASCSNLENAVYLSDLATCMKISVTEASKAVRSLKDKGYVIWKTDEKKERTYVALTNRAVELMRNQRQQLVDCYNEIVNSISDEDLKTTLYTMDRVRKIIEAHPLPEETLL
ncbi:MAG: MarR family transcriptional regulator [Oscillospiraceae bacterium]|jgi:DNA-binding MarR family transcriptional regulator